MHARDVFFFLRSGLPCRECASVTGTRSIKQSRSATEQSTTIYTCNAIGASESTLQLPKILPCKPAGFRGLLRSSDERVRGR